MPTLDPDLVAQVEARILAMDPLTDDQLDQLADTLVRIRLNADEDQS